MRAHSHMEKTSDATLEEIWFQQDQDRRRYLKPICSIFLMEAYCQYIYGTLVHKKDPTVCIYQVHEDGRPSWWFHRTIINIALRLNILTKEDRPCRYLPQVERALMLRAYGGKVKYLETHIDSCTATIIKGLKDRNWNSINLASLQWEEEIQNREVNEGMEEEGDVAHLDDEEMVELQPVHLQLAKEPREPEHDTSTVIIYLKREPPSNDFVKINTDGSYYKYEAAPECPERDMVRSLGTKMAML
ncbi:hypothetical protein OROMI_019831 [Orobanche minor]